MSKKIKNSKLNSTHLLDDDSEIEDNADVNWAVKSNNSSEEEPDKKKEKKEQNEDDEDYYDYKEEDDEDIVENIVLPPKKKNKKNNKKPSEPEINIEIIKGEKNEKCVQITIKMALENKTKDIITIDFTINKKTFLKIAKELK